jgi:hypothetical protein
MMVYSGTLLIILASCIGTGSVWETAVSATILLNIGRGLAVVGYILVLIVTAIIWGLQASWQVVYLSDFFLPPALATSIMLWSLFLWTGYQMILTILTVTTSTASTLQVHGNVVAPVILQYLILLILCACHNLILSFFPYHQWDDVDLDDKTNENKDKTNTGGVIQHKFQENDDNEPEEITEEIMDACHSQENIEEHMNRTGYHHSHYDLEQNSIREDHPPKNEVYWSSLPNRSLPHPNGTPASISNAIHSNNNSHDNRFMTSQGEQNTQLLLPSSSQIGVQIIYGDDCSQNNDDEIDHHQDTDARKDQKHCHRHVYGKYDDFIFGHDIEKNGTMINVNKNHQMPPRRFFEQEDKEEENKKKQR